MITEQTWNNIRVEYIDELTYQFSLREKIEQVNAGTKQYDSIKKLIDNSCERCRNYDFLIQSHSRNILK